MRIFGLCRLKLVLKQTGEVENTLGLGGVVFEAKLKPEKGVGPLN